MIFFDSYSFLSLIKIALFLFKIIAIPPNVFLVPLAKKIYVLFCFFKMVAFFFFFFFKWCLSLHTDFNVEEEKRKLVKICPFDTSDYTNVNVTNSSQLETIYSFA